ncbi:hypothetical protein ACA910_010947 [Epithemia clementina (nom. ined.)]
MNITALRALIVGIHGTVLTEEERCVLQHPKIHGVILFTRNYENPWQLRRLCQSIHELRTGSKFQENNKDDDDDDDDVSTKQQDASSSTAQDNDERCSSSSGRHPTDDDDVLQIYVDQEGGRVQRFRGDGFTTLPATGSMATNQEALQWGHIMATELLRCGVDWSLAPVCDLDRGSLVLGGGNNGRSFSADPETVVERATAFMEGMALAGMRTGILKHFPGHGSVMPDTHHQIAVDDRTLSELEQSDLRPFIHFLSSSASSNDKRTNDDSNDNHDNHDNPAEPPHVSLGVMVAHVRYPQVDAAPASLSKVWITDYLRGQLGFRAPIYTDDLGMKAVNETSTPAELVQQAFDAGANYALLCNNWQAVLDTLQSLG